MKKTLIGVSLLCTGAVIILSGCGSSKSGGISDKTGWNYNDPMLGGFDVNTTYPGQQTGPGLTFVEGGRFTMGQTEEDLTEERNNIPRTVSVSSFYMDETEVANVHYREYTYWMKRSYNSDYPDLVNKSIPDENVWRQALSYNEPYVQYYFKAASYNYYPVVGINWNQANDFCKWRSDRVNEYILIKNRFLKKNKDQVNEDVFTTETYVAGQYDGTRDKAKRDLDPSGSKIRNLHYDDGFLLPNYRLPTEAEWEYAALGLIGNNPEPETKRRRGEEVITDRNVFPWSPKNNSRFGLRNQYQGEFLGNFKRGGGDVMGVAGGLNDYADIPAPVYSYQPNAFGLYNMAGNVSEWVLDVYRPNAHQDVNDFRPFRGNQYTKLKVTEDYSLEDKDSIGHLSYQYMTPDQMNGGNMYESRISDVRSFNDGDSLSQFTYNFGTTSLINDDARVYKGASWNDRAYWMSPGSRRFMQADQASAFVGFRCVMDRMGTPNGDNRRMGGNYFGKDRKGVRH